MKKIISLLLSFLMISVMSVSVFAAQRNLTDLNTQGIYTELTHVSGNVIKATVYLTGSITNLTGYTLKLRYDSSEVLPCKLALDVNNDPVMVTGKTTAAVEIIDIDYTLMPTSDFTYQTYEIDTAESGTTMRTITVVNARQAGKDAVANAGKNKLFSVNFVMQKPSLTRVSNVTSAMAFPGSATAFSLLNYEGGDSTSSKTSGGQPAAYKVVDKIAYSKAVAAAKAAHAAAVEGTSGGQYPVGSKTTLNAAIVAAEGLSGTATQSEIDTAVTTLNGKLKTFTDSVITASTKIDEPFTSVAKDAQVTIDNTTSYTFSGDMVIVGADQVEAGVIINGMKFPAISAPGSVLRNGKFAVVINGWDSLKTGSYTVGTYTIFNDGEPVVENESTFTKN